MGSVWASAHEIFPRNDNYTPQTPRNISFINPNSSGVIWDCEEESPSSVTFSPNTDNVNMTTARRINQNNLLLLPVFIVVYTIKEDIETIYKKKNKRQDWLDHLHHHLFLIIPRNDSDSDCTF